MSGVHGDERSGPLALLQWLESMAVPGFLENGISIWLAPLINDWGWERCKRRWGKSDLNRAFTSDKAPLFLRQLMDDLSANVPLMFLDLHEPTEKPYAHVYDYTADRHDMTKRLAKALNAHPEPWTPQQRKGWRGTSEVFVRDLGCCRTATTEVPKAWPLEERIRWNLVAVRWCLQEIAQQKNGGDATGEG